MARRDSGAIPPSGRRRCHRFAGGRPPPGGQAAQTPLEPYLAQFRIAARHYGWSMDKSAAQLALALEGTAVQVLLDLAPAEQWDLWALTRALERRFGHRAGLAPPQLGQHVRFTGPPNLKVALHVAERAERELSDLQPSGASRPHIRRADYERDEDGEECFQAWTSPSVPDSIHHSEHHPTTDGNVLGAHGGPAKAAAVRY
ncbi:unnamed protein product [Merluccius merluccius]